MNKMKNYKNKINYYNKQKLIIVIEAKVCNELMNFFIKENEHYDFSCFTIIK